MKVNYNSVWFNFSDALSEHDVLTSAFEILLKEDVVFVEGNDGFLSFQIKNTANIKVPYRMVLPEKFYEFGIQVEIQPESTNGGYIFSVLNPLDTIIQLGLQLSRNEDDDMYTVTLYYTDSNKHMKSQALASFKIPYKKGEWYNLGMQVFANNVTLLLNCEEVASIPVKREPMELVFDSASTLYLAQAGPMIGGKFEVCKHYTVWLLPLYSLYVYLNWLKCD